MSEQDNIFNQTRIDQDQSKKGGGLFKKEVKKEGIDIVGLANEMNSLSRRVRVMEERHNNLRRKTQITDQNMLLNHKKLMNESRIATDDVLEVKRDMDDVKEKIKLIIKELQSSAKKEDVDVLTKYINLWEPVNFITRSEVEKLIEKRMNG